MVTLAHLAVRDWKQCSPVRIKKKRKEREMCADAGQSTSTAHIWLAKLLHPKIKTQAHIIETSDHGIDCRKNSPITWLVYTSRVSSFLLIKFLLGQELPQSSTQVRKQRGSSIFGSAICTLAVGNFLHTANLFESFLFASFIYIFIRFPTKATLERGVWPIRWRNLTQPHPR